MLKRFLCLSLIIGVLSLIAIEVGTRPLPPVRSLEIRAVRSERYNQWEPILPHQTITREDHGGRWMHVITREVGFSNWRRALMNREELRILGTELIHLDGDRIADGRDIYWIVDGHQSGRFFSEASSRGIMGWPRVMDEIWIR